LIMPEQIAIAGIDSSLGAISSVPLLAIQSVQAKMAVTLVDAQKANLEQIVLQIKKILVSRNASEEEQTNILSKIHLAYDLKAASQVDLFLDASLNGVETLKEAADVLNPKVILVSLKSHGSLTQMGEACGEPKRTVGINLFVGGLEPLGFGEIIRGVKTSSEIVGMVESFLSKLSIKYIISNDFPGFVLNRILFLAINEATQVLYEGVATAEEVDRSFEQSHLLKKGPLALADAIGLDYVNRVLYSLYQSTGKVQYIPSLLLQKYVEAGYWGVKSGKGFYDYEL